MMFKLTPNPTFDATLTIIGQGQEQKLKVTFRHMDADAYAELLALLNPDAEDHITEADAILKIVEKWDADGELTNENVDAACKNFPGFGWAIIGGYGNALTVARKGN